MLTQFADLIMQSAEVAWDARSMWNQAPHGLLWWIFLGLVAGWLAGKLAGGDSDALEMCCWD